MNSMKIRNKENQADGEANTILVYKGLKIESEIILKVKVNQ